MAHGLSFPHGHPPDYGVSVHVVHLLHVAKLVMLAVVIALARFLQSRRAVLLHVVLKLEDP